jgi:hypothetical protein
MNSPNWDDDVVLSERAVPRKGVVIVGVDERSVDVEDRDRWHLRRIPQRLRR